MAGAGVTPGRAAVPPVLERAAAYSWRLLVVGAALAALLWVLGQMLVVVVPLAGAALISRGLAPVAAWLRARGWRPGLAAGVTLLAFLLVLTGALYAVGASVVSEFDELGATVEAGIDDIENWLVDDSPFDIEREQVQQWRADIGDALTRFARTNNESVLSGAVLAAEVVVGMVLALVVTFFFLKDGRGMVAGVLRRTRTDRRPLMRASMGRAWAALGGYLQGAALLGLVESIAIGVALFAVGGNLVAPVMVVTFMAAFVPIVGAVVAGVIATLVALATAGLTGAVIVAVVALVVQQLDNDLLAPVIYGRALRLHALVILLGIATGGALFGFVGTFLAVPVLAVGLNVLDEVRRSHRGPTPAVEPG